jgi:hypothetical protein
VTRAEADSLVAALDLDVDDMPICLACLSFVCMDLDLDSGDNRKIAGTITRVAPDLWAEGLALPVRMALARARDCGVVNADRAIADVEDRGFRSAVVRAIVRRLAEQLHARAKGDLLKMGFQPWPPPGLV